MLDLLVTYWMSLTGAANIRLDGNIGCGIESANHIIII